MNADRQTILAAIYAAIDETNAARPPEARLEKSEDTLLFGEGAKLDSLGLVTLVMTAEQMLFDMAGLEITLATEAAMSRKRSPYRSVRALADYAAELAGIENAA